MHLLYFLQSNILAFYITSTLLGLVVGSFLNVVIYRLPKMMHRSWREECCEFLEIGNDAQSSDERVTLVKPRSSCPNCQQKIRYWENIPLISYLFLKGRCSGCHSPISIRYPAIELLTGLLSFLVAWQFGFGVQMLPA